MTLAGVLASLAHWIIVWIGMAALFGLLWAAVAAGLRRRRSRP